VDEHHDRAVDRVPEGTVPAGAIVGKTLVALPTATWKDGGTDT